VNPKTSNVVALPRPKPLVPVSGDSDQPKPFRFAVTWQTLLAFPQPMEVTEAVTEVVPQVVIEAPSTAVVVVMPREMASQELQVVNPPPPPPADEAAWEMVVPKMVRG
jgi:hypothetical protein